MTLRTLTATTITLSAGIAASAALADGHATAAGFALANDGRTLVVMSDIDAPDSATMLDLAAPLDAIATRPVTGDLLGFANGGIYTIDTGTGALTDLGASFMEDAVIADDAHIGLDFNNAIDAVRAVSTMGDNLVYFPKGFGDNDERAGSVRRFTALAYMQDDDNEGIAPAVFANAYTNAISGMTASATVQYVLDANANVLATLANNDGTLVTVAPVTIDGAAADILPMGGFDIISAEEGQDMAYAILQRDGQETAGLYTLDLTTGAATLLADLGMGGIIGLAVAPAM